MSKVPDELVEWHFDFGLCATEDDQMVPYKKCEELLFLITEWAEKNKFGVGGGFRPFAEDESATGK